MAGNFGFLLKGMSEGISTGFEMGWKKKQQKKLEAKEKEVAEAVTLFNNQIKQFGEDKIYSEDEISMIDTSWLALGAEAKEITKGAREAIKNMNQAEFDQDIQWLENSLDGIGLIDPKNAKEIFDYTRNNVKTEKAKRYLTAYENMYKKKYEAMQNQPTAEVFTSPSGVTEKYPKAGYEYSASAKGYVPTFQKPTTPETPPTELDKSTYQNKMLDSFKRRNDREGFNLFAKANGLNVNFDTYGQEVKPAGGGTEKPRATSLSQLEEYRNKALDADTWEDAESVINDYTEAGYDASQLGVSKEAWVNSKKTDLDNLVLVLNEITAGTPNVKGNKIYSFEINGKAKEQTGEEWFKQVYESYVALLKLLEEQGIDTSQYKKLKPLSEIKKAGFWKGAFTGGGVEKGDLPSIYY